LRSTRQRRKTHALLLREVRAPARAGHDVGGRPVRTHGEKRGCSVFDRAMRRRSVLPQGPTSRVTSAPGHAVRLRRGPT
jgi:hypothetical protein